MSQPSFDFDVGRSDGGAAAHEVDTTWSVCDLIEAINGTLRQTFGAGVWIRGEIQGWNERGPHAYFRLVEDRPKGKGVINVSFFAPSRLRMRPMLERHRLRLGDGVKVRIFGHLDLYGPSGQLGLKVSGIDPRFTLGEMAMQRDDVVRRLVAAGVYDANRGRPLAVAPLRVGVVTSVGSAAWADFVHEIERSGFGFQLRVIDVRVQGAAAVPMVSRAVQRLGARRDLDVVAIVRGGGAKTELATFDHEAIAQAIVTSALPVFTGLGHEIDRSIADDVAHTAFKTPTACAAALGELVAAFMARTEATWEAVAQRAVQRLERGERELDGLAGTIVHRTRAATDRSEERVLRHMRRLQTGSDRVTARAEALVDRAMVAIARSPRHLDTEVRHLDALEAQVRLMDPVRTMARGWSITRTADGRAVTDAASLVVGQRLVTTFASGRSHSRIEALDPQDASSATLPPGGAPPREDSRS